jgi:hypothetical protein
MSMLEKREKRLFLPGIELKFFGHPAHNIFTELF